MKIESWFCSPVFGWITRILQPGVAAIFLLSSIPKLLQPQQFLSNVYDYHLLGQTAGLIMAIILPWLELLIASALLSRLYAGGALLLASLLGLVFLAAQGSIIMRDIPVACGCFGLQADQPISKWTWLRTFAIFGAAALGYWLTMLNRSDNQNKIAAALAASEG